MSGRRAGPDPPPRPPAPTRTGATPTPHPPLPGTTTSRPPQRQYPHVDTIADWRAQQSVRLLWDRAFDLEARLQQAETTVPDLQAVLADQQQQLTDLANASSAVSQTPADNGGTTVGTVGGTSGASSGGGSTGGGSGGSGGGGGAPAAHHTTHESGGTDEVTLAQSQITGLPTALAGKVDTTDPRLSDARTPLPHHATHEPGGSDALAVDAAATTGSLRTLGSGATQAAAGNDARLSNARTPTAHHTTHEPGGSDQLTTLALSGTLGVTGVTTLASRVELTGGQIHYPATQLPSTDPNTADDYREGYWTPADASGQGLTITALAICPFVKNNQAVIASFYIQFPTTANATTAQVGGLPFTIPSLAGGAIAVTNKGSPIILFASGTSFYIKDYAGNNLTWAQMSGLVLGGTFSYQTNT